MDGSANTRMRRRPREPERHGPSGRDAADARRVAERAPGDRPRDHRAPAPRRRPAERPLRRLMAEATSRAADGARALPGVMRGLSGRLLILTVLFVLLAEITIFVPSVANFRLNWLNRHFETAEAISLVLERLEDERGASDTMRAGILVLTGTDMIAVRREGMSRVLARRENMDVAIGSEAQIGPTGGLNALASIRAAFDTMLFGDGRTMRVHGPLQNAGADRAGRLELISHETPLREAMLLYARNVALISLLVSLFTASLVFLALRAMMIRPMQRIAANMEDFAEEPGLDAAIAPTGRRDEIGQTEERLHDMQVRLSETLASRERLATLGLAVSKINHDLRNLLSSALLFSDRLAHLPDPTVQRVTPKLVRSVERAIDYTQAVMAYGKAAEAAPRKAVVDLYALAEEVAGMLPLAEPAIDWSNRVPPGLEAEADPEQLFRVVLNLARNAVQAMESVSGEYAAVRRLEVSAEEVVPSVAASLDPEGRTIAPCASLVTRITVSDTGPGIAPRVREKLFQAFEGSAKPGSTGLGLAIAAEIVRAHGGTIGLAAHSGPGAAPGAAFVIDLPRLRPGATTARPANRRVSAPPLDEPTGAVIEPAANERTATG